MPERDPIAEHTFGSKMSEQPYQDNAQVRNTTLTDETISESGSTSYYTSKSKTMTSKMHTTSGDNTSNPFIQEHTPVMPHKKLGIK